MNRSSFSPICRSLTMVMLAIQACTILPPRQDTSRFFILTPTAASALAPYVSGDHQISIGVGPVRFPGYLKRPEMVTRIDADRIQLSAENRWAEPLDSNFQRVLAQDLAQSLGTERVVLFPWFGEPKIDYQVEVQVHRFDADQQGQSALSANWSIKDGHSGAILFATETTTTSATAGQNADESPALSLDVEKFAGQIAEQIIRLNQTRTNMGASASSPGAGAGRPELARPEFPAAD